MTTQYCLHRTGSPIGKLRCNCANQPAVYRCQHPEITSGYCVTEMMKEPGDGPVIELNGHQVHPQDERRKTFYPWPMKPGETPRPWEIVVCSSCSHIKAPPDSLLKHYELGIDGDFDKTTGACDVLHVVSLIKAGEPLVDVPAGFRSAFVICQKAPEFASLLEATRCRLAVVYGTVVQIPNVKVALKAHPEVRVWMVRQDTRANREKVENVWWDLPDDVERQLEDQKRAAYRSEIGRILE